MTPGYAVHFRFRSETREIKDFSPRSKKDDFRSLRIEAKLQKSKALRTRKEGNFALFRSEAKYFLGETGTQAVSYHMAVCVVCECVEEVQGYSVNPMVYQCLYINSPSPYSMQEVQIRH